MSEKQSTDELVRALEIQLKMETDCVITNLEIRAIIARLRAADKLCAAAKEAWPQMSRHNWNNECQRLYEAIAEYEEGK